MNILYTRKEPICPWCIKIKEKLTEANVSYDEFVLGEHITKKEYIEEFFGESKGPRPTVPLFIADGAKRIGGYEDTVEWIKKQKEI